MDKQNAAAVDVDAGFTLDETLLAQRQAVSQRRLYTVQIPALRAAGFAILSVIVLLHVPARPAGDRAVALVAGTWAMRCSPGP